MVSALLQGIPTEVLTYVNNTTCTYVVSFDKSDSSTLYHLELVFVCFDVRGPNCLRHIQELAYQMSCKLYSLFA